MRSIRMFLLAGLFLVAMIGVSAITPNQAAWAVDLNIDLTPDRDSGIIKVVPERHDRDPGHERLHDNLDEQHERFHDRLEHERFHRELDERHEDFHDRDFGHTRHRFHN